MDFSGRPCPHRGRSFRCRHLQSMCFAIASCVSYVSSCASQCIVLSRCIVCEYKDCTEGLHTKMPYKNCTQTFLTKDCIQRLHTKTKYTQVAYKCCNRKHCVGSRAWLIVHRSVVLLENTRRAAVGTKPSGIGTTPTSFRHNSQWSPVPCPAVVCTMPSGVGTTPSNHQYHAQWPPIHAQLRPRAPCLAAERTTRPAVSRPAAAGAMPSSRRCHRPRPMTVCTTPTNRQYHDHRVRPPVPRSAAAGASPSCRRYHAPRLAATTSSAWRQNYTQRGAGTTPTLN